MKNFLKSQLKIICIFALCFTTFSCKTNVKNIKNSNENEIFATSKFINGTQDIPLVNGLEIINDHNLEFDSLSGSFSSSTYQSNYDIEKIKNFYELNLPKLGWQVSKSVNNSSVFTRDNEKLEIEFSAQEGYNLIVFCHRSIL
ncbi:MAG: hypothetical protein ACO26G_05830 [Rickettsiales bacterium]